MPSWTAKRVRDRDDPVLAAGDHDAAGTQVVETRGLPHRVGFAQDQLGLVGVGNEDVGVGKDDLERLEIVAGPGGRHVEQGDRAGLPGPREALGQLGGVEARAGSGSSRCASTRGGVLEHGVEIGGDEARVGADAVDEPPIFAADVDDQRLAGGELADRPSARGCRPCALAGSRWRTGRRCRRRRGRRRPPRTPSRARSTAVLAAPPPMFSTSSSTVTSSPASGRWSKRRAEMVGHDQCPRRRPGKRRGGRRQRSTRRKVPGRWHAGGPRPIIEVADVLQQVSHAERRRSRRVVDRGDDLVARGPATAGRSSPVRVCRSALRSRLTDRTSRSIRASVRRSSSSRCSSSRR